MASYYEPMDVDEVTVDSENKENAFRHNGPGAPADRGCEDLDMSEMNMRLRLSCTPLASPAPSVKRFTGSAKKLFPESGDNESFDLTITNDSADVTMTEWSMGDHNANSLSERDSINSSVNSQTEDKNKTSVLLQSAHTIISDDCITNNNATLTLDRTYSVENTPNMSPNAVTPVSTPNKDLLTSKPTSPIMRGLKSVLNMFRPSQSPIASSDSHNDTLDLPQNEVSLAATVDKDTSLNKSVLVSTPVQNNGDSKNLTETSLKGTSPNSGDSLIFNEDLINELQWNDDSTIIFNRNKMPVRRLYTPSGSSFESRDSNPSADVIIDEEETKEAIFEKVVFSNKDVDTTVDHMEVSMNESNLHCVSDFQSTNYAISNISNENKYEIMRGIVESVMDSVFERAEVFVNESCNPQNGDYNIKTCFNEQISDKEKCSESNENNNKQSSEIIEEIKNKQCNQIKELKDDIDKVDPEVKSIEQSTAVNKSDILTSEIRKNVPAPEITEYNIDPVNTMIYTVNDKDDKTENYLRHSECSIPETNKATNIEEVLSSENKTPNIFFNAPGEENINELLPVGNVPQLDYDLIENPFATKCRISVSPPRSNINLSEIESPCLSRPQVTVGCSKNITISECIKNNVATTQAIHIQNIDLVPISVNEENTALPAAEADSYKNITTSILNDTLKNVDNITIDNITSEEYKESIETSSPQESDNLTLALELTSNSTFSDIAQGIESQEQSDAYLSADSGRESEQLLDSELDLIDKNTETQAIKKFALERDQKQLENEIECASPKENLTSSNVKTSSLVDCENSLATRTNICMSPPVTLRKSITAVKSEIVTDSDNPFKTKTKLRMSPVAQNNGLEDGETTEISFTTKSELHMSPYLTQENITLLPGAQDSIINKENEGVSETSVEITVRPENFINEDKAECNVETLNSESQKSVEEVKPGRIPSPASFQVQSLTTEASQLSHSSGNILTEIDFDSIDNPFAKKSRMSISPPRLNSSQSEKNPFITKSKIAISPSTSPVLKSIPDALSTVDDQFSNKIFTCTSFKPSNVELSDNHNEEETPRNISVNEDINGATVVLDNNATYDLEKHTKVERDQQNSSGSSDSSCEKNTTIKEVKTEDEDTLEGPDFVGLEETMDNPFETKSKIRISPVFDERSNYCNKSPKIIQCSEDAPLKSIVDDFPSEDEFMECMDEEFKPGELFINADTFDFLMNKSTAGNKDNGKESLFLKFDPLCAQKRRSAGSVPNEVNTKIENVICHQSEIIMEESAESTQASETLPILDKMCTQRLSSTPDNLSTAKDLSSPHCYNNSTPPPLEKPMMAVMPAVNNEPATNSRSGPYTPTRSERRSINFSSPAIAAIDRLISLSGNNSPVTQAYFVDNTTMSQDTREAMAHVQELLSQKDIEVDQLKQENKSLQDKLTDLEIQTKGLQEDNIERLKKIDDLKSKLAHKTVLNNNMSAAVEQYERAIASLITENKQEKQRHERERADLIRERDEQVAHLSSMEVSFSDLHTKYERTKQLILTFKSNEESLRRTIEEYKQSRHKLENNYETLKEQATSKMNKANMEMDKLKRSHEAEVVKLTAQVKRKELHATSLEESLAQKIKANEELTAICDELISKVR